jgi:hypothetical protein
MEEFNALSLVDRASILAEYGKFVQAHTHFNYRILLYSLNKHFIEVYCEKDTDKILWILIANEYDLQKHLEKIEIDFLIEMQRIFNTQGKR